MVRARAGFHRDDTAAGQLRTPGDEPVSGERTAGDQPAGSVDGVHLDHALGQIDPHSNDYPAAFTSCNLLHGLPPSMA